MGAFSQPTWQNMYQGCAAARAGKHRSIRSGGGKSSSLEPGWQAGGLIQPLATLKGTNVVIIQFFAIYLTKRCNFMVRATI